MASLRDAQSAARQEYTTQIDQLKFKMDELGAIASRLEERVNQLHRDLIFPWRADLRRHGWSEDEVQAVGWLRHELVNAHPLAPVITLWEERYPDVARKLRALEETGFDSHLKDLPRVPRPDDIESRPQTS
jgi:hypothetical protein